MKIMTFGFVFGRKWLTSFVFVSVSAENKMTFSAPVSFSAENVYTGFGRSLVSPNHHCQSTVQSVLDNVVSPYEHLSK